jgi:hypothetical protein
MNMNTNEYVKILEEECGENKWYLESRQDIVTL